MNAALDKALAVSPRGSSRNVVSELTPGVTHRWGVMDALIALEKRASPPKAPLSDGQRHSKRPQMLPPMCFCRGSLQRSMTFRKTWKWTGSSGNLI